MTQVIERPEVEERIEAPQSDALEEAARFRWTLEQFERMQEEGWFGERRVELLDGEIWQTMSAGDKHWQSTNLVTEALRDVFPRGTWTISTQGVLKLGQDVPEPDVAVIAGDLRTMTRIPTTAALIVEVSDATLRRDKGLKASIYARARISDYWIVDLQNEQLIVLRTPMEDAQALLGWRYASEQTFNRGQSVSSLAKPDAPVAVSDLLP